MSASNLILVRRLTEDGLRSFDQYISSLRSFQSRSERETLPALSPTDQSISQVLSSDIGIDASQVFANRYALSSYLYDHLSSLVDQERLKNDVGFWAWLALLFFGQLTDDLSRVSRREHYIPSIGVTWRMQGHSVSHRHSIRESYVLYESFREESKVYFNPGSVSMMGNMIEQLRSRGDIRRNRNMHSFIVNKYARRDGDLCGYAVPGAAQKPDPSTGAGSSSAVRLGVLYRRLSVAYFAPLLADNELSLYLGPGFEY